METSPRIGLDPLVPSPGAQAIPLELQPILRREGGIHNEVLRDSSLLVDLELLFMLVLIHRGIRKGDGLDNQTREHPLFSNSIDLSACPFWQSPEDRNIR